MQWFENWFDTPYYKILYQHRNENEAQRFISNLLRCIPLNSDDWILDLACGRGRHAKFIHRLGYKVYGLDLSKESIKEAQIEQSDSLKFEVQDMRTFHLPLKFQCILSLFTSFGYFEDVEDNLLVLKQVYHHLLPEGYFVLDFFHTDWVLQHLLPHEIQFLNNVRFEIERYTENQRIIKKIEITDGSKHYTFYERVHLFTTQDLEEMLKKMGFRVLRLWGDYELHRLSEESPRVIFWVQKTDG